MACPEFIGARSNVTADGVHTRVALAPLQHAATG
jgi:hypothetical protein